MWLSLVERLVRDQEAGSSNLLTPTTNPVHKGGRDFYFFNLHIIFLHIQNKTSRSDRKKVGDFHYAVNYCGYSLLFICIFDKRAQKNAYFRCVFLQLVILCLTRAKKSDTIYVVDAVHYIPESQRRLQKYKFALLYLLNMKGINRFIRSIRADGIYNVNFYCSSGTNFKSPITSYICMQAGESDISWILVNKSILNT